MHPAPAALVDAIREAPEDDAPRLVCADWFEDQGDEASVARAAFIRTQLERAKLPPEDVRHSELDARELRLLKRFAAIWCGSHFVFRKARFRRGFIEYVHLHLRHFLHHRRQMFALEPVRDVSLTGWFRAPVDLVRRVAGCAEWEHVETLRVHHQGPHNDPRGDVVALLESPHLTRLRALHCPLVVFDADARRRFERLPVLRRVRELHFPTLDTLVESPGEWFSGGGAAFVEGWAELRSFTLPHYLRLDLLRRFSEMPWWGRLTALELVLTWQRGETLALLRDRMPPSLQELRLFAGHGTEDFSADPFFGRLAGAPLRSLHLHRVPVSAATLGLLLDREGRSDLRELSLTSCQVTEDHARALAASAGVKKVWSLNLSGNRQLGGDAARSLFSSEHFGSVVDLNLSGTRIGTEGAIALAGAPGWDRLRWLDLSGTELDGQGLRALLASPNVRRLTWLTLAEGGYRRAPSLDISPDVATAMTRLPHLANLLLSLGRCDPRSKQVLSQGDSLAWLSISDEDDIQSYRAHRSLEGWPPLDATLERVQRVWL